MGYRDGFDAALEHARALEGELGELRQSEAANQEAIAALSAKLDEAQREVARLRSRLPGSPARSRKPFWIALWVTGAFVLATGVAGYMSESLGMQMAFLATCPFGFAVGGLLGSARSSRLAWALALGLGLAMPALLWIFFLTIWPSL
jgi:Flp pilus assembly protein TadB